MYKTKKAKTIFNNFRKIFENKSNFIENFVELILNLIDKQGNHIYIADRI